MEARRLEMEALQEEQIETLEKNDEEHNNVFVDDRVAPTSGDVALVNSAQQQALVSVKEKSTPEKVYI